MSRKRLDNRLVENGLVQSREKAKSLVLAGFVLVNGKVVDKAGTLISETDSLTLLEKDHPFVGRGGVKLEGALKTFQISVSGQVALDAGSSTGGFVDCLFQHGAERVYAVDVGKGLLDWTLRSSPRLHLIEGKNVRFLTEQEVPEPVDLITADLSFISLKLVLPVLARFLKVPGKMIVLVKPQFEVGKGKVGKGGIVRDKNQHQQVIEEVARFSETISLFPIGVIPSPITGQKGNREYFIHLVNQPPKGPLSDLKTQILSALESIS